VGGEDLELLPEESDAIEGEIDIEEEGG